MKSLAALMRAYDLDAGDTIYIDTGAYKPLTNVVLGLEDSGVTLQGPQQSGHAAVINRGNTSAGNYGLEFVGGVSGVTVDDLEIFGAEDGIHITSGSNIEIRDSFLRNNANRGIYIELTSSNIRVLRNQLQENTSRGIEIRGSQVTVDSNVIRNSEGGVLSQQANGVVLRNNDIFGHTFGVSYASGARRSDPG